MGLKCFRHIFFIFNVFIFTIYFSDFSISALLHYRSEPRAASGFFCIFLYIFFAPFFLHFFFAFSALLICIFLAPPPLFVGWPKIYQMDRFRTNKNYPSIIFERCHGLFLARMAVSDLLVFLFTLFLLVIIWPFTSCHSRLFPVVEAVSRCRNVVYVYAHRLPPCVSFFCSIFLSGERQAAKNVVLAERKHRDTKIIWGRDLVV